MKLEIRSVSKRYGAQKVLQGLNLELNSGEMATLLGQNGAGKTTLLRILAGLQKASTGEIFIDGQNSSHMKSYRRKIGAVMHQTFLYEYLSAAENLKLYSDLYNLPSDDKAIKKALDRVGLGKARPAAIRTFSRGMKQRLTIARALIADPFLLLLDEPYTGLDLQGCLMLNEILREEKAKGKAILATSHELEFVRQVTDRFAILNKGRITDRFDNHKGLDLDRLQARFLSLTAPKSGAKGPEEDASLTQKRDGAKIATVNSVGPDSSKPDVSPAPSQDGDKA